MSYAERRKGKLTGRWIGERVVNGQVKRCRADVKKVADDWELYIDRFGALPMDGTGSSNPHTIGALKVRARSERADWKATRDPSLDQRLEEVVKFFGPTSDVDSVTNERITDFIKMLEKRRGRSGGPLSGKTINRYLAVVSGLMDHARFLLWTKNTPVIPWQNETKRPMLYLKDWQDEHLLAALADRPLQVCFEVLTAGALRPTEFFSLEPAQIDIRNEWAWLRLWKTKTDNPRSVPVDVELGRELLALIEAGRLPSHEDFYDALKKASASCGFDKGLCVYSLRHTGLTRAARGNSGARVQHFAGHSDFRTTQNYIHLEDADMADVAASMSRRQ